MDSTASILIGLFLSFVFLLDLFISKKTKGAFIRALVYALSVALPSIYSGEFPSQVIYGFGIGLVIGFILIYFGVYKKSIKKVEDFDDKDENLEFFNLLMNGYGEFKRNIDYKLKEISKKEEKYNKTYLKVHDELKDSLPKFIIKIYSRMHNKNDNFTAYATFVMQTFINDFFSNSNARFTLRVLDSESNEMVAEKTTRDKLPTSIPLSSPNMIKQSLKVNKPLIYSEHKKYHYDTSISIQQKVFDDYVTYCIEANGSTPVISVNLDVKGEESVNKMKAFVKTNIFTIVCDSITLNYNIQKGE